MTPSTLFFLPLFLPLLQDPAAYRLPPPEVVALLDAPETPRVDLSPDARFMLLVERPSMPSIAEVSRPWIGLAGTRLDPVTNAPWRSGYETGILLRDLEGANERRLALPEGARIANVRWSHTSTRIAITLATDAGTELWIADVPDGAPRRVATGLNAFLGRGFDWTPDGLGAIVLRVPEGRGPEPATPSVPRGPVVQETSGTTTPLRTFQDLLASPHDEALFAHYGTSRIARVDFATGKATPIGAPAFYAEASVSPDGAHLLVERIERPFSYVLPENRFPRTIEVWNLDGRVERTVAKVPLGEHIPMEGVRTEPRSVHWRATAPATLVWAEALDGGDPKRKAEWRDRWMALDAPFTGEPREIIRLPQRARGLEWLDAPDLVFASDYDRDRRWGRTLLFDLSHPEKAPIVVDDRNVRDRYGDPGSPMTRVTARGTRVVRVDGEWVYRSGSGATPEGALPFLDRFHLGTQKTERLWRCAAGTYERVTDIVTSSAGAPPTVVTEYESPTEPPNHLLRDLAKGAATPLTKFPDPQPALRGVTQELVTYERKDGVSLSATLYLPANHRAGERLPLVVWAYPLEYTDPDTAGQVSGSPSRFVRVRGPSHLLFLTQGYAIMDSATMPVVGDPETMNDTFIEQIVSSAQAAIDTAAARGVGDPKRVGVGGHSYGAFMTANLLAHCDLFAAGIARSGAYNRTLTPFGFQSERRTIWEAVDAYVKLSPFFSAHRIQEPILFIHGEKDSNSGTFPIQSERMYQAVKGNGGTARLVFLPHEDHGYRARESVLHATAEMLTWFDRHVKHRETGAAPAEAGSGH